MPAFPDIPSELTCEHALNMILVSIATEELALSHILSAESEKLSYILDVLSRGKCDNPNVKEILEVNQSVASLIDSVSQNQMLLKGKMEKALQAMKDICPVCPKPCPDSPTFPPPDIPFFPSEPLLFPQKCCAVFKNSFDCYRWQSNNILPFKEKHLQGCCASLCDDSYIEIGKQGYYMINLTVNLRSKPCCDYGVSFFLSGFDGGENTETYSYGGYVSNKNKISTHSFNGIVIEHTCVCEPCRLCLRLKSPDAVEVENAVLSIVEI